MIEVNGKSITNEKVKEITLNGTMEVYSQFDNGIELKRILFPSTTQAMTCEKYILTNKGNNPLSVEIPSARSIIQTDASKGVDGSYRLISTLKGEKAKQLQPGESLSFSAFFAGYKRERRKRTCIGHR